MKKCKSVPMTMVSGSIPMMTTNLHEPRSKTISISKGFIEVIGIYMYREKNKNLTKILTNGCCMYVRGRGYNYLFYNYYYPVKANFTI